MARAQALVRAKTVRAGVALGLCGAVLALGNSAGSFSAGVAQRAGVSLGLIWVTGCVAFAALTGVWLLVTATRPVRART